MSASRWRRRGLVIIATAGAVVVGAVVFAQARREPAPEVERTPAKEEYVKAIAPVATASSRSASRGDVRKQPVEVVSRNVTLRLTGSLMADEKSDVGSNAAGLVWQTFCDRGSFVKKGDVLIQLDPRDAQYALEEGQNAAEELRVRLGLDEMKEFDPQKVPEVESARLAMQLAERTFRRSETLKKQNAVALEAFDQAETEFHSAVQRYYLTLRQSKQAYQAYRQALTHVTILKKALDDCSIRAPFDGWVSDRAISVGERVIAMFPGAKLVTLLRIDPMRLSLTVPQQDMAQIKVGQTVTFRADAFPDKTFTATVRYITPAVTSDNRSMQVEAVVPNPGNALRPGLFVTAELELDKKRADIFVPQAAVRSRGDVAALFVVRNGTIREQIVSLGEVVSGRVQILSGLGPGDIVITTPDQVRDGDRG